ncbi:CamS family sex pheromone protein [Paenisporosarcina sp. TG-14]|uniref:CamS family sex pheromone protein n=1 Tax=Paenisporosarcina sp. TG-14 TaxID=1231057 RepID=UPI0002ECC192|nr:CamS family sex pheromone protein [Paenisporosarcina sp. TG-14]
MKRFSWIPAMISIALLSGCMPNADKDTEVITETEKTKEASAIIPSVQISEQYYRTLLPYEQSASRGLVVSKIFTKYDLKEVENGLLRLSQRTFSPDDYFFQEGQTLDSNRLNQWLARSSQTESGLNPPRPKEGNMTAELAKTAPVYLAHIVEQNYLVKTKDNKIQLAGISIGLAMNSNYYYQKEDFGATYEESIPQAKIKENGRKMANEIVKRMRAMEGLENIPITVGIFKQESRNSIVPGSYFEYGVAAKGKAALDGWTSLNEEYVLFPQPITEEKYRDVGQSFNNFKQDIEKYFSNYTSVVGTGFYQDDSIKKMTIEIPIQFYGAAELVGFTQYMTGLVMDHFPASMHVEVNVTSINGAEALVIKKADETEPYVHIYD